MMTRKSNTCDDAVHGKMASGNDEVKLFPDLITTETIFVYGPCVALVGGDLVAGCLLSQIIRWSTLDPKEHAKVVKRSGVTWIAMAPSEWGRECGITLKQYKKARAVLLQRQLIDVRLFYFGGKVSTYIRLLEDNLDRLNERFLEHLGVGQGTI